MKINNCYDWFDWEPLSQDFHQDLWRIDKQNIIKHPISLISINRDKNLSITMKLLTNHPNRIPLSKPHPKGILISDFDKIQMSSEGGTTAVATVIFIKKSNKFFDSNNNLVNTAELDINELEVKYSDKESFYTIEWITNLRPERCWLWPDSIDWSLKGSYTKKIDSKEKKITIEQEDTLGHRHSSNCAGLTINDLFVFIGETESKDIDKKYNPGFILYEGNPNSDVREKVRLGLSYTLGRYLPTLGYSKFDKTWSLVSYKCICPYDIDQRVYNCQTKPPFDLKIDPYKMNNKIVSNFVTSFFNNFDKYDLRHISSLYWNALNSTTHVKASQLGATLESLQRKYIKKHEENFQTRLIVRKEWQLLRKKLIETIESSLSNKLNGESDILLRKIDNLNQTPQSHLTDRFFEILGLELGDIEKDAFRYRNFSAHGKRPEEFGDLIKNNDVLRTLVNRVLIKILNCSSQYIDYYTVGHPSRVLKSPIA